MKPLNKREKELISACYRDCHRIAMERHSEAVLGEYPDNFTHRQMAKHIATLCLVRKEQILDYGCDLPHRNRKRIKP